jgi:formate dehydrogenase subunit gamma
MNEQESESGFGLFFFLFLAAVVVVGFFTLRDTASLETQALQEELAVAREATGGAQTREDIMARQQGLAVDDTFRREALGDPGAAAPASGQLGTLGGVSDSEMFRALRYSEADVNVTSRAPAADVIIQDTGMAWLEFREGPLARYGGGAMIAMIVFLGLFYIGRGRIMIDGEKTGKTMLRFAGIERFAHWMLGVSFILLGITGLISYFGRQALIPLMGHEAYSVIAIGSKWVHNNLAWPFMIALVMVFVLWIWHNIPDRTDIHWLARGGGLFVKGVHPPAKKFNAGQKLIFWSVVILGFSISASGLSLLFPFELPMFAKTFAVLNQTGIPQFLGFGTLPENLLPHEEMQFAQAWHSIVAFAFMTIVIAHIYIGSIGMEGAFDAMGSGHVETQWAKEHHSIWYQEHLDWLDEPQNRSEPPSDKGARAATPTAAE